MRRLISVPTLLAALVLAGCADDEPSAGSPEDDPTPSISESATPSGTPSPTASPTVTTAQGTTIATGDSEFGPILFDGRGQAIYIWEVEESSKAECYGDCAEAWPPVLTSGQPVAEGAVRTDLLGTTKRRDGAMQVTYGGHPLYFYAHEAPHEVKCHNIATHGGLWWVVTPQGGPGPT